MTSHASARRVVAAALALAVAAGGSASAVPPPTSECPLLPVTNVWNKRVDDLPVAANSERLIGTIGRDRPLHPDFGVYLGYGIPYNLVAASTPRRQVQFLYDDESDHVA